MRRRAIFWLIFIALLVPVFSYADEEPAPPCQAVLLYETHTGEVLYAKNADRQMTPASITKIMTALLVLENADLSDKVTIPKEAVFPVGSHMDLKEGEVLTVEQLLNALMVDSANDAALALAIHVAGSEQAFVKMMNDKAKAIGATHTHYLNPNGYTEDYSHTTTAEDIRIITDYALKLDGFRDIVGQATYTVPKTNESDERQLENTNHLLWDKDDLAITVNGKKRFPYYPGTFGIKTGMMASSGYCLVAGVDRDGMELIAVCLKAETQEGRFESAITMFDWAFVQFGRHEVYRSEEPCATVRVRYGKKTRVPVYTTSDLYTIERRDAAEEDLNINAVLDLDEDLEAPLAEGTQVGTATVYHDGEAVMESPVILREAIDKGGPWSAWYLSDRAAYTSLAILVGLALLVVFLQKYTVRRRRARQHGGARAGAGKNTR